MSKWGKVFLRAETKKNYTEPGNLKVEIDWEGLLVDTSLWFQPI